jgi:hypothetical protein
MPLPTTVKLSSIHCRDEADGIGNAEPYLWTIFFKIDGETIKHTPGQFVLNGNAVFKFGPGSHENLGTHAVDPGDTVQIPPAIGEFHTQLQPIILTNGTKTIPVPGIVGAIAVLMEEDNVSDSGAEKGHQALNNFVQTEINNFIHGINLIQFVGVEHPEDKLNELIEAMKKKIQDGAAGVVSTAIEKAQGFWSNLWSGINADDKIGSAVWTFSQQDIVQHHYAIALNQRWRNEGDWEMFGVISAPNPCQAHGRGQPAEAQDRPDRSPDQDQADRDGACPGVAETRNTGRDRRAEGRTAAAAHRVDAARRPAQPLLHQADHRRAGRRRCAGQRVVVEIAISPVIARSGSDEAIHLSRRGKLDCFAEPVSGRRFALTRWLAMKEEAPSPYIIPCSSSSAFSISSSLTTTLRRGTRKNIAAAQATDNAKMADVSGSVVAEWPPR